MQARIDRNATITPPAIAAALAAEKREERRGREKERKGGKTSGQRFDKNDMMQVSIHVTMQFDAQLRY